ncbi:unnamed protein product [Protopolystoma xenopodis]|uniref:Protein kinase domain-containing protein n=1 Tax=Protopolystoma xenopodis TaxID=117903 RepID=A0A448WZU7_9PLAT|nr:unnamed protein product [Protopolystoma xenopodis]
MRYPKIYFLGLQARKRFPAGTPFSSVVSDPSFSAGDYDFKSAQQLIGFDDPQASYIVTFNDHIAYRYEPIGLLGKGSFGQVVRAIDHATGNQIALKIIRNETRFARQAAEEIKILETLRNQDMDDSNNVIHLLDHFTFRGHVCMTFELLSINLYELIHRNRFKGFSCALIIFSINILAL